MGSAARWPEKLASCGATVGAIDIDANNCTAVADDIRSRGGRAFAYVADVASRTAFMNAAGKFARECGRIDAVVNNAMLLRYEPVEQVTDDTLDRMLGIGIKGAVWGAQALLAHMNAERGGAIINMASPVAEKGFPNTAAYSLVKGAIVTLTKALAAELGPRRVRVNAVAPGSVPTPGALGLNDAPNTNGARAPFRCADSAARKTTRRPCVPAEPRGFLHQRRDPARGRRHRRGQG